MPLRISFWTTCGLYLAISAWSPPSRATAQTGPAPPQYSPRPQGSPLRPDQPVVPHHPTLQRRPAGPPRAMQRPQPRAPFQLTAEQEAYLDKVLLAWEKQSARVKTFECEFTRWEYDPVFGDPNKPKNTDQGKIKYAAPDKGSFEIAGERAEKWVCDGEWIHEFNHAKKQIVQHQLPPELRGQAIADGPLPFLFGAQAAKLKQRYFLRVIQPPAGRTGEIWLEAFPKYAQDAANFSRAELILTVKNMTPFGMDIYLPNGRNHSAYQFFNMVINDPLRILKANPFRVAAPRGWQTVVKPHAAPNTTPQVSRQPAAAAGSRR